jgi:hypothetical protein
MAMNIEFEVACATEPVVDELRKIRQLLETLAAKPAQIQYVPYYYPQPQYYPPYQIFNGTNPKVGNQA